MLGVWFREPFVLCAPNYVKEWRVLRARLIEKNIRTKNVLGDENVNHLWDFREWLWNRSSETHVMITSDLYLSCGSAFTIPGMEISDLCVPFTKFTSLHEYCITLLTRCWKSSPCMVMWSNTAGKKSVRPCMEWPLANCGKASLHGDVV